MSESCRNEGQVIGDKMYSWDDQIMQAMRFLRIIYFIGIVRILNKRPKCMESNLYQEYWDSIKIASRGVCSLYLCKGDLEMMLLRKLDEFKY